jgi:hypothetical protein
MIGEHFAVDAALLFKPRLHEARPSLGIINPIKGQQMHACIPVWDLKFWCGCTQKFDRQDLTFSFSLCMHLAYINANASLTRSNYLTGIAWLLYRRLWRPKSMYAEYISRYTCIICLIHDNTAITAIALTISSKIKASLSPTMSRSIF